MSVSAASENIPWDATTSPVPHVLDLAGRPRVASVDAWRTRREELTSLFAASVYGRMTFADAVEMRIEHEETDAGALDGLAERRQFRIVLSTPQGSLPADVLLYLPAHRQGPVPAFASLNFCGNHGTTRDPGVWLSEGWHADDPDAGYVGGRATEASRGTSVRRWPFEEIVSRGYAVATCSYGDFDPDVDDGFSNGAHGLQEPAARGTAGAIAAWSWGLSRILDLLQDVPEVDAARVVALGHSRLGKAALWAAATDERFAMAISNDSGCGGASLSRRAVGESIASITTQFPHWFPAVFAGFAGREAELPMDQHHLLALLAPRPVYVASATEDLWADPDGEFLSARLAGPAYELFGRAGITDERPPRPGTSVGASVGYHRRAGGHDILVEDWRHYLDFADRHLGS
jgi:hypothetical protein